MTPKPVAESKRRRPYAARVPLEERREQLLDATLRVIDRDGYDRVTVEAVAREAGVTKPVVYSAFDSLAPLLDALLDRQQGLALLRLFSALPPIDATEEPAAFVESTVRAWLQMVREDHSVWGPILMAQQGVPEVVVKRIELGRESVRAVFADLIGPLAAKLDPAPNPLLMAHAVIAMAEHFGRLILAEPDRFDEDELVVLARTILSSILPKS